MANNVILGSDLMLFADTNGKLQSIACAKSCKLTISGGTLETSSKDSGKWTEKQVGKLSWNASSENLLIMTEYTALVNAMISRQKVMLEFGVVAETDDNGVPTDGWSFDNNDGYKGYAVITSIDMSASDGDNATYSVSFEGCGALEPR